MEDFNWQLAILTAGVFSNMALVTIFYHLNKNFIATCLTIPLIYWGAHWVYHVVKLIVS